MKITGNDLLNAKKGTTNDSEKKKQISGKDILQTLKTYQNADISVVDKTYIDTFFDDAETFLASAEKEYEGLGWGNASSSFDTRNTTYQELSARADTIGAWYYKNKSNYSEKEYADIRKRLDDIKSDGSKIVEAFKNGVDYYAQWKTEDAYNRWYEKNKQQEEERNSILSSADFEEYYQRGKTDNDNNDFIMEVFGKHPVGESNYIEHYRKYYADALFDDDTYGGGVVLPNASYALAMTEDEVKVYDYYLGKYGKKRAEEYLDSLKESLNQRVGEGISKNASKNKFLETSFAFTAGVDQFMSGIGNIDNFIMGSESDLTSPTQHASSIIRNNLDGGWGVTYDLLNTTGNMAPSILVSMLPVIGSVAGKVSFGASAIGNAYKEMRDLGYNEWQSRGYATLVGASEVTLEALMGGIGKLGGSKSLSKAIENFVGKFDHALARFAIEIPLKMSSEAAEEVLQTILEPCFKWAVTGFEDFESAEWEEILYSALLGALSAGTLEGIPGAIGTVGSMKTANEYKSIYGDNAYDLVKEALEIDPDSEHAKKMQAKLDGGKKLSGYNIGHLAESIEQAIQSQDKGKIKAAVQKRLAELGETGDISVLADVIVKAQTGEKLTHSEKAEIESSIYGKRVLNELNPENIASGEYASDWTGNIGTERIGTDIYNRNAPVEKTEHQYSKKWSARSAAYASAELLAKEKLADETRSSAVIEPKTQTEAKEEKHIPESTEMVSEGDHSVDVNEMSDDTTVSTEESTVSLEALSKKYGAQAKAFIRTYNEGQDVKKFDSAYQMAYDMGKSGVSLSYVMKTKSTEYLTKQQRELAYEAGQAAAGTSAKEQHDKIKAAANGKTGRKKGTVKGEGVTIADLKKSFNDTQNRAYKILCVIAEVTGIDIVLTNSEANADGEFEGAQGRFNHTDDKIYIDINAGLRNVAEEYNADIYNVENLAKYAMLRTFSHEFTHFLEKYNAVWYNEFRKVVFETLTENGKDVNDLIEKKIAQNPGMENDENRYDRASREVVAEAMTDILPDSQFIETMANKHKNIFEKLHEKLKEFLADIKAYFSALAKNPSREANALKETVDGAVRYLENIVKMFDEGALAAVENYQNTVATNIETNIEPEVTEYAEQGTDEENRAEDADTGRNQEDKGSLESVEFRAQEKDGNRSRISEEVGETGSGLQQNRSSERQHRNENEVSFLFDRENYISPPENTPLYEAQKSLVTEYGVECHVLSATAWNRKNPACAYDGKIYISEVIDEYTLATLIPHEMTHVMKHKKFQPYLDFIDNSAEWINLMSNDMPRLFQMISGHRNIDFFDMDENQQRDFFDELNAFVYGIQQGGFINNPDFDLEWLPNAFYDFDAYIQALSDIHDQFKAETRAKNSESATAESDHYDHFSITENTEYGSLEIKFDGKPSDEIRDMLKKEFGFRWHKVKGVWFGKAERAEIAKALQAVYKAYDIGVKEAQVQKSIVPASKSAEMNELEKNIRNHLLPIVDAYNRGVADEINRQTVAEADAENERSTAEFKDQYDELAAALQKSTRYDIGGVRFEIKNHDGKYSVSIRRIGNEGPYPIENARDLIYKNDNIQTYEEAVQELTDVARSSNLFKHFDPNRETVNHEEEKPNDKENVNNERPILEPDTDGQRTSRLLDEPQTEDVRGTSPKRDSLGDSRQREHETSRDGNRTHADTRNRGGEGSGKSGDLRRDELTEQETQAKAEELAEVAEEQIEQKSTVEPKGSNFVIGDSLGLPIGEKARFRANVDAIRLIKKLETEGRFATASEQEILSKYVGWGGLSGAFGELIWNRETKKREMVPKDDWKNEFAELKSLIEDGIITKQEYKDMSASTINAHYTSVEVIKAMYDGLGQLGFNGGRMLEPSSGVGNFVGAMPAEMSAKVNSWTMVELDRITGQIAKYLYPNADVRIQGFESANIPNNYMDVVIGNVPFGDYGVVDRTYPKRITKSIHNYFFAKSIDKVRPGGIVMFITSSFTMNSQDETVRRFIMDRADLLGAIRLPNTAFKGNAGTEVVTDILILKKRESGTAYAGEDFARAEYDDNHGSYVSDYFKNHPEMVLGKAVTKRGMYGAHTLTYEPYTDRGTIDDQIREAFQNIKGKMDYPKKLSPEKTNFAVERAEKKTKSGGFVVNPDGSISKSEDGQLVKVETDEKTAKRIAGMLGIRDAYRKLANYLQQGLKESEIKKARKELNTAYDAFVEEHGYINAPANKKAISIDPDSYSILSLENYDAKKKTSKKADIFTKDTISANKTVTHVDSIDEGVIASINLTGGVDVSLIAKLTDKSAEDVTREVIESRLAFKTREGCLIARETYLSGNVRAKLREAESLAPYDKDFNHNIEELRKVIPADIPYNEIYITPGATFIPNEIYADFIAHMLGGRNLPNSYSGPDVEVGRTASGEFKIVINNKRLKNNHYNTQTWGTARKSFLDLIDCMMGSRTVKVNDVFENADGKKVSVVNEAETEAANEKVKAIQKEFEDWLWKDENRRNALAKLYNETFNAIVNPKYDGSHLTVNGINAEYSLREHQANAVHRIISSGGNTLLAHKVGAGKTLEMAAAAMKMRELGVIKKPVFVVPKSVVAQWGVEFHNYFPAARLLVADDKSFTPANRKIFTNKIANGDYDAVIVTYEQFEKIPMSAEYQARFYEEQIDEIINAIAEEKAESRDGKGLTVKEMEKKKAQLEKKLKELTAKPKDENNVDFEMLGIDSLFVDEAHNFKNLEYVSKMSNVAGLGSTKGVQRAFDLYTKVRYLQGLNGGRGVVFATATPVMNSMVELYIMQRYLQPDVLNQLGLKSFDAWAKQFGEVVNKWEINPSGTGMRQKQVFANFRNLNELQLLFRSFADVLTEVPGLKIPKMKGGAVKIVECEPGEFQKNYMQDLQKRAENVKSVDPSEDNMLKITSDGRKVSYTQRMIDPTLPYEPGCKIFKASENIVKEYQDSKDIKGTQIVFLDMATPKGTDKTKAEINEDESTDEGYDEESARLYEDMRDYLVKKGVPKREIAFIHEADTDAKRKQLFEDVNNGKVRVLIGSTGKMGVGMNAQKRVVAIHHLDAPWRPGDVEQRDGRAFRQKNMNEEVSKYVYVTKGSFDSRLWDILDRKQHFISQIMNGEDVGRTAEDTGEVTLSAAEVKALASGNPLIEEQTKLTDEIKKLENLQKAYHSSIRLAKAKLADDETRIANSKSRIAEIREDISERLDTYSDGKFSMTVGKQVFSDKKEAGAALASEIVARANKDAFVTVGKFAGFELRVIKNGSEYNGFIHGNGNYKFNVYLNNTTRMVNHIGEIIADFEKIIANLEQFIDETSADRDVQNQILAKPFEKQSELDRKRARFNEVMALLSPKNEQQLGKTDEDVQEQSREYLEDEDEQYQQRTSDFYGRTFSYDELMAKGEIVGTTIKNSTEVPLKDDGSIDAKKIVETVRDRCQKLTLGGANPTYFVYATDIDRNVQIASKGITHGFFDSTRKNKYPSSRDLINAKVSLAIPDILSNSIEVNRSYRKGNRDILYSHIMMGTIGIVNESGVTEYYAVRSVIEERKNLDPILVEAEILGKLHAVNAKKIDPSNHEITEKNVIRRHGEVYFGYSIAHLLEDVKGVFTDTFSEDVYERLGSERTDTEFSRNLQYQQRTETLTDRDILEIASLEIDITGLSEAEQDALSIFQSRLAKLEDLREKRIEQGRLYKEQKYGEKPDEAEAEKTLNRMHVLDGKIRKATEAMLIVEEKDVLKRVVKKAREAVEENQRQHDREILERWRNRVKKAREAAEENQKQHNREILERWRNRRNNAEAIKKYRDRLRGDVGELSTWILKPDDKDVVKHVPDVLKNTVIPFLSSIDFMSKRSLDGGAATKADKAFMDRLKNLQSAMKTADADELYSGYCDLPADFMDRLDTFIKDTEKITKENSGEFVVNRMTSGELKELSQIVKILKKSIIDLNRFHNNAMFQHVFEAGENSVETLKAMKKATYKHKMGFISNFLFWQQIRPAYAFERFGEGGKSIYDELRAGQAKLAFNTKEIERFAKEAYTEKEVKEWEDEIITFKFGEDTVKIPVSYIMSFYELYKDKDGRRHIEGGGIRVANYDESDPDIGHVLTRGDIDKLIQFVDDRPRIKEVADKLQKYMAEQGGKWGNHVSVARFGEELFTNKTYFPINSDGRLLPAKLDKIQDASALYALLNMSFTKSRQEGANNRIVIYSIFDVFANHMASIAQYNAMALPVLDAVKWFNYKQVLIDEDGNKTVTGNLREQMDRVYGVKKEKAGSSGSKGYATAFVENIIKAFNGTAAQGTQYDSFGLKPLHRYNMAQVAYNFRVVIQQPMAITRAGLLIDYNSIRKGLSLKPATIKKNVEEMQKYSGIAAWKSLGFYDVNISRGLTHIIKHDSSILEKVGDFGMLGAEKLDTWTWAAMWSACKEEVIKKKKLKPSDGNFYDEVTKLFEDVIYKTQVVDSVLTKNEFMRDKGFFARLFGSFMSEATTTASMLLNAYDKYNLDIKGGMTKKQAWQKNKKMIGRTLYVYAVGQVLIAAFQSLSDAWRDDDEYENYGEKYLDAFVGNIIDELSPFNKLPVIDQAWELLKAIVDAGGFTNLDLYGQVANLPFADIADQLIKSVQIFSDKIMDENTNYTWWGGIYKLLQATSGMAGLPLAAATREIVTAWNNTVAEMAPSLRIETYKATSEETRNALYEAIISGDYEETERIKSKYDDEKDLSAAIRKALRENDSRIKEAAQLRASGDIAGYMQIAKEIIAEGNFKQDDVVAAINAEISTMNKGETSDSEDSDKAVSLYKIGDYYVSIMNGNSATAYAVKYDLIETDVANGKDRDEAEESFNSNLTNHIKVQYRNGSISDYKAKDMLSYAGKTAEEAASKVQYWKFQKQYPGYADLSEKAVSKYYSDVQPSGISLAVYYNYIGMAAKATGVDSNGDGKADSGTKKQEILRMIHSLPISSYQKDVLYHLNGWAESTLYQAPWH